MLDIKAGMKKLKSGMTWMSVGYIVLGLILALMPTTSMLVVCYVLGGALLLFGLIRMVNYIRLGSWSIAYYDMSSVVLSLLIGLLLVIKPDIFITLIPFLLGFLVMVDSAMHIQTSFELKSLGYKRWFVELILAAVTLVLGILMVFNPFSTANVFVIYLGVVLIVDGVMNLVDVFYVSHKIKKLKNEMNQ